MIVSYLIMALIIGISLSGSLLALGIKIVKIHPVSGSILLFSGCAVAIILCTSLVSMYRNIKKDTDPEHYRMTENDKFYEAVTASSTEKMIQMLEKGHNPNKMSRYDGYNPWDYHNPLWIVLEDPKDDLCYEKAGILIKYGADLRTRPFLAHLLARTIKSQKFPEQHLKRDNGNGWAGFDEEKFLPLLTLLLDNGADINARQYCCDIALWDWNYRRQSKKNGYTALNRAVEQNAFILVDFLLAHGASFDEKTDQCVQWATDLSGSTAMKDYVSKLR